MSNVPDMSMALGLSPSQHDPTSVVVGQIGYPAPTAFGQMVNVLPQHSPQNPIGPMDFGAAQGQALPTLGATCVVIFDQNSVPYCVWFDVAYVAPNVYLPQAAPAAPASGFVLYCDQATGDLKAVASSGTITTVATP